MPTQKTNPHDTARDDGGGAVFYTVDSGRQTPRQKEPGND